MDWIKYKTKTIYKKDFGAHLDSFAVTSKTQYSHLSHSEMSKKWKTFCWIATCWLLWKKFASELGQSSTGLGLESPIIELHLLK